MLFFSFLCEFGLLSFFFLAGSDFVEFHLSVLTIRTILEAEGARESDPRTKWGGERDKEKGKE